MGRNSKFSAEQILDAAQSLLVSGGGEAATVTGIAEVLGAPSGSIYHRFGSRDLIIATLWVRTVRSFQMGYLQALNNPDRMAAQVDAVRHVLSWSAANPERARLLLRHSREQLLGTWPEVLGAELSVLNDGVRLALTSFASDWFGGVNAEQIGRARLALIELPYAAVRLHLEGNESLTGWLLDAVLEASRSVLAEGRALIERVSRE